MSTRVANARLRRAWSNPTTRRCDAASRRPRPCAPRTPDPAQHAGRRTARANPFLRVRRPRSARRAGARRLGRAPADRVDAFAALRRWKDGFAHDRPGRLASPAGARCAWPPASPLPRPPRSESPAPPQPQRQRSTGSGRRRHSRRRRSARNGREIYRSFRAGLADPDCDADASVAALAPALRPRAAPRWPAGNDDVLPLFGYVVDAAARQPPADRVRPDPVRRKRLPARRAQRRRPGRPVADHRDHRAQPRRADAHRLRRPPVAGRFHARRGALPQDPARHVRRRLAAGGDGLQRRRIPRAAARCKRSGQNARNAQPEQLAGLSDITHAYVHKLHALSCLLEQADDRDDWLRALDRPCRASRPSRCPRTCTTPGAWAHAHGPGRGTAAPPQSRVRRRPRDRRQVARREAARRRWTGDDKRGAACANASSTQVQTPRRRSAGRDVAARPATRSHTVAAATAPGRIARRYGDARRRPVAAATAWHSNRAAARARVLRDRPTRRLAAGSRSLAGVAHGDAGRAH